ncbi:unnamed protein product [Phyllotreta striolata]|uniref:Uncharacterized protein n=1 Tax=Phyllotreta striolata TaxID=444603 RepID=A0A9N9XMN4_PHYSR|nr:unnamed protein product [Phyllotreta striolata]
MPRIEPFMLGSSRLPPGCSHNHMSALSPQPSQSSPMTRKNRRVKKKTVTRTRPKMEITPNVNSATPAKRYKVTKTTRAIKRTNSLKRIDDN